MQGGMNDFLTRAEAADILGVHVETVTRWADQGVLATFRPALADGRLGHRRYSRADVEQLLAPKDAA